MLAITNELENFSAKVQPSALPMRFFNEQRRTPRHAVRQIAMMLTGPDRIARYCLIVDKSAGGVRLHTRSDFEAPNEIVLRFADTETTCKIVWRNGQQVGAERVGRVKRLPVRRFGMR